MTKFSWRRESSLATSGSQQNWLVSGVDRAFKSSTSAFQMIGDRLNPLGKSVDFDILFLGPPSGILLTYASMMILNSGAMKMRQVPCISGPCEKDLSVFGYGWYWDHLSLYIYGHMERIEIQNHSRNKVSDSGKDHGSLFAAAVWSW